MKHKIFLSILIPTLVLFLSSCQINSNKQNANPLKTVFEYAEEKETLISALRGGKSYAGYPENCIETMQYIQKQIPNALYEIDIAQTKDSILILMHDDALDRTTTGTGRIDQHTFAEISTLYLKDDKGELTKYKIPSFKMVLHWAKKQNAYLSVDIKRSVSPEKVLKFIEKHDALYQCVIITYSMDVAKKLFDLNNEVFLSVSIRNMDEFKRFELSGIPWENIMAFTGTRESNPELYEKLHAKGVMCILGTLGNLDNKAAAKGDHLYRNWEALGVDIFATDRPIEAFYAISKQ